MRRLLCLLSAACFATGAHAQELRPGTSLFAEPDENNEPINELDALSRNADDPFEGVIDRAEREPVSVTLRALDKITARYTDIEINMNEIAHFGSLEILPRYCDKRPPEEFPETTAFLEVFDREFGTRGDDLKIDPALLEMGDEENDLPVADPVDEILELEEIPAFGAEAQEAALEEEAPVEAAPVLAEPMPTLPAPEVLDGPQAEGENIFRGWMFASSPALNALEHPVYDVWVINCTTRAVEN